MKICPDCNGVFDNDGVRFCPNDGIALVDVCPGTRLGERYEIIELLGQGGMGVVYLANHVAMNRRCALKLLRADALGDKEAATRLLREAKTAMRIDHANVVDIYDAGETPGGVTFIVMEYVEGETLAQHLDTVGILTPRLAARIVWQTANALASAHRLEIVHRDIKPANIMITHYGEWDDFVKVLDFGIAKPYGAASTTSLTSSGQVIGTPAYMSPEQRWGLKVDHRSDLYSLGLVTVRMLAGALPLDWPQLAASGQEILNALPTTAQWPDDVKQILTATLAPDPNDRPDSAQAFASEFVVAVESWSPRLDNTREPWDPRLSDNLIKSLPHGVRRVESPDTDTPHVRRVGSIAVVAFLILGIAGVTWGVRQRASPSRTDSPLPQSTIATTADSGTRDMRPDTEMRPPDTVTTAPRVLSVSAEQIEPAAVHSTELAVRRLRDLVDLDAPNMDSLRQAVDLAGELLAMSLPESTRVEVTYHRAEAHLVIGDEHAACEALRALLPATDSVVAFGRSVRALIQRNCEPD